jgi:hypothetical protein
MNIGQDELCQDLKKDLEISTKSKKKSGNTSDMMQGFSFVISVTGFNRPSTEKMVTAHIYFL